MNAAWPVINQLPAVLPTRAMTTVLRLPAFSMAIQDLTTHTIRLLGMLPPDAWDFNTHKIAHFLKCALQVRCFLANAAPGRNCFSWIRSFVQNPEASSPI